jgi:ribonuclease J
VRSGRLAVDGTRLIPLEGNVMTARRRVGFSGAAVATVVLDGKGRLVVDPKITVPGLMDETLDAEAVEVAIDSIVDAVERLSKDARRSDAAVAEAVRAAIRRTLKRELGKRPVTEVHVMRI